MTRNLRISKPAHLNFLLNREQRKSSTLLRCYQPSRCRAVNTALFSKSSATLMLRQIVQECEIADDSPRVSVIGMGFLKFCFE